MVVHAQRAAPELHLPLTPVAHALRVAMDRRGQTGSWTRRSPEEESHLRVSWAPIPTTSQEMT